MPEPTVRARVLPGRFWLAGSLMKNRFPSEAVAERHWKGERIESYRERRLTEALLGFSTVTDVFMSSSRRNRSALR